MNLEVEKINNYLLKKRSFLYKELGEKLKEIRKEKNISVNELSNKSFISSTYICQIERGEYGISLLKFITICNTLNINPDAVLQDFIISTKYNDDILFEKLQDSKNISENIFYYMKCKK